MPILAPAEALDALQPAPGLVVLMCGLAGSGKSTFSKQLEAKGFVRLSIDEEVWTGAGRFGVDFEPADYERHLEAAHVRLKARLVEAVRGRTPAVLDTALWNCQARVEHKGLIEAHGGGWRLVYMKGPTNLLRSRLLDRSRRFDADAQFPITDPMLDRFIQAFEEPDGEGEIVVTSEP
jgi:predicted kinase